jgi:pimeloyl-ACP methyl ester carboxylesterase
MQSLLRSNFLFDFRRTSTGPQKVHIILMAEIQAHITESTVMEKAHRAINVIIRPPRAQYSLDDLGPVPTCAYPHPIPRIPIAFKNRNGFNLVGSFYPSGTFYTEERHVCVIYLHGNVGSQNEGRFLVPNLSPRGISVFCFDFSGSGLSGGDFVTLGFHEHLDVIDSIEFLSRQFKVTDFVLWGRSMGAGCAVMASSLSPQIRGIIVDSAFSSISDLFSAISHQVPMPSVIRPMALWWIKHEVETRAHFDCNRVAPAKAGRQSTIPLMLGHCQDDAFIPYSHGEAIFEEYGCADKEMMAMTGGHNGRRDIAWIMKCVRFILRVFGMKFEYIEVEMTMDNVEHVASFTDLLADADE